MSRRVPRPAVIACVAVVLLLADLRVTTFEATAADEGNAAYAGLRDRPAGSRARRCRCFARASTTAASTSTTRRRRRGSGRRLLDARAGRGRRGGEAVDADQLRRLDATAGELLTRLGVTSVVFHGGLFRDNPAAPDTAAFAWDALVEPRLPAAGGGRAGHVADSAWQRAPPRSPVAEPPRDVAQFCEGWRRNDGEGRVTSAPHASLWAYNPGIVDLRLFLRRDGEPEEVRISVDGRGGQTATVSSLEETRVPLGDEGWHLVTLDGAPGVRVVAYALN